MATGALIFEASLGAARATFTGDSKSRLTAAKLRGITIGLHVLQPLARLCGRLRYGLAPWRRRSATLAFPMRRKRSIWDERWKSADQRLKRIEQDVRSLGCVVRHGSEFDRWDLEVRGGMLGVARMRIAVEEHGAGRQLVRFSCWPKYSRFGLTVAAGCAALAVGAALDGAVGAFVVLAAVAAITAVSALRDTATATGVLLRAIVGRPRTGQRRVGAPRRRSALTIARPQQQPRSAVATYVSENGHLSGGSENGHDPEVAPAHLEELPSAPSVVRLSSND
jgi:hypothetical protein